LIFLSIFTVELGLQFIYYGWRLFFDGWLVFDLVIIVLSWALQGGQIARAFRIFRALRLITRIAVLRNLVIGTNQRTFVQYFVGVSTLAYQQRPLTRPHICSHS
jgi:hypothetical protein